MRLLAAFSVLLALSSGVLGCSDTDHPIDIGGAGKGSGGANFAGASGSSGAHVGGGSSAGASGLSESAGEAGAAAQGGNGGELSEAGSGGTTAGAGGTAGASAGTGGAAAGMGGAAAGMGGAAAGMGGAAAGMGGAAAGMGGEGPVPAAPTGLLVAGSATQLTLTWTDVATGEIGYRVFISPTNTQPATAAHELAAGGQTYTFAANEITPYTAYYVWVAAYNANGNSTPAAGSGTAGSAPNAPTGITIDTSSPFSITTTWTDASDNESSFEVFWSTDDSKPSTPNAIVAAGTQSYKLTQVFGARTYRFWVEAVNVIGRTSAKATASAATTDLVWNGLWMDNGSIHLAMADTYNIVGDNDATTQLFAYQSELPGTLGTATAINPYVVWDAAAQNIDITKLHYFWAEARKPEGSLISLRTLEPSGAVTGLAAVPTDLDAAVTWFATAGAKNYQVYSGTGTFAQASYAGATLLTNAPVIGLNPGTSYNFWVRTAGVGIGGSGNGFPGTPSMVSASTTGTSLGANLAAGKVAVASSEAGGNVASNVTDGTYSTRWESSKHDPEWIYVDLGATYDVTHVKLVWESAYSQSIQVQVCPATCDDSNAAPNTWAWTNAYAADRLLTGGFPNYELLTVTPTSGQFVRMLGLSRATEYAHSLYEVEVYSAP